MNDRPDNHAVHSGNPAPSVEALDPLERQLRSHLGRRAATVGEAPITDETLLTLRREAAGQVTSSNRRRVSIASISGVAAVALAVGLIINNQGPQPVDSTNGPANAPSVAGAATGSSTGSTTGAMKGWSSDFEVDPASVEFPMLTLALPQTTDDRLSSISAVTTTETSSSLPAAPIAVLADLQIGSPLRFVTASVQTPDQLTMGSGGAEITIKDRPARVIRDNAGSTRILWSMDDEHQVLIQAYGIPRSDVEQLATTLHTDDNDTWTLDPGTTGLNVVDAPAPTSQQTLYLSWATPDPVDPDPVTGRSLSTTDLNLVSGGAYEFWATLATATAYGSGTPEIIGVDTGGETATPAVLTEVGRFADGSTNATLDMLDPSGTVVHVNFYEAEAEAPAATPGSAFETLRSAAPSLLTRLDAPGWQNLLAKAIDAAAVRNARMEAFKEQKMAEDRATGPDPTTMPTSTAIDTRDDAQKDAGVSAPPAKSSVGSPSTSGVPTTDSTTSPAPTTTVAG